MAILLLLHEVRRTSRHSLHDVFGMKRLGYRRLDCIRFFAICAPTPRRNKRSTFFKVFQVLLMLSSVSAFIIVPWNKLNLIRVMLASFFGAFLGFVVFRVPIVRTILRVIALGVARLLFMVQGPTFGAFSAENDTRRCEAAEGSP